MIAAPSICARTRSGLTTVPQSTATSSLGIVTSAIADDDMCDACLLPVPTGTARVGFRRGLPTGGGCLVICWSRCRSCRERHCRNSEGANQTECIQLHVEFSCYGARPEEAPGFTLR